MKWLAVCVIVFGSAISFRIDGGDLSLSDVSPLDMTYYFYSLQNPDTPVEVKSNTVDAVKKTHFDASKDTIILIHGYGDSAQGLLVKVVKNDIVAAKQDLNIIGLDWSPIWKNNPAGDFFKKNAPIAGKFIAQFLGVLSKSYGLKYSKLTIVGHSAGGPISGAIGLNLDGEVKNIVGLDTSGINKTDAQFVEYIHTTPGSKGDALGHADYYPNGGSNQTGCSDFGCNHWRAIAYYAESMNSNKFVAKKCDTYENYEAGKCNSNPSAIMGQLNLDTKAAGKYFLETNGDTPYAKG